MWTCTLTGAGAKGNKAVEDLSQGFLGDRSSVVEVWANGRRFGAFPGEGGRVHCYATVNSNVPQARLLGRDSKVYGM